MSDLNWPEDPQIVTDAEFAVVRGAYREFEEHPERPGWRFTGHFDKDGDPLWHNFQIGDRHPNNPRAEFIGLFDDKARPLYYVRPRILPEWLQEPITLNRERWERRTGWKRTAAMVFTFAASMGIFYGSTWKRRGGFIGYLLTMWLPLMCFTAISLVAASILGLRALARAVGLH